MYNKTIIRFDFCDIQNKQGLGKDCQPEADNPYRDLDWPKAYNEFSKSKPVTS